MQAQLQILPEGSHEVHRGPAQDEGPLGSPVGLPRLVRAVGHPHADKGDFPFDLKTLLKPRTHKHTGPLLACFSAGAAVDPCHGHHHMSR